MLRLGDIEMNIPLSLIPLKSIHNKIRDKSLVVQSLSHVHLFVTPWTIAC